MTSSEFDLPPQNYSLAPQADTTEQKQKKTLPDSVQQAFLVGIDAAELQKVLPSEEKVLYRVLERYQAMSALEHGMSPLELLKTIIVIETRLPEWSRQKTEVDLKANKASLPRSIEYDPASGNIYIHLKTKNVKMLGKGMSKTVTRSLLYNAERPQFAAQAITEKREPNEIDILRKLSGKPGIVKIYGVREISASQKKNKPDRQGIMLKFYNGNTLGGQYSNQIPCYGDLSTKQKEQIALGIVTGLKTLHENNIVHNDLHQGQILIEFLPSPHGDKEEVAQAVITDFGHSFSPLLEPEKTKTESDYRDTMLDRIQKAIQHKRWVTCSDVEEGKKICDRLIEENNEKTQKYFPGCVDYQDDVRLAGNLLHALLCGKYIYSDVDIAYKRYKYEDAIKAGTLNPNTMESAEKIEYLALRMMSLLRGVAPTAAQAHAELAAILAA